MFRYLTMIARKSGVRLCKSILRYAQIFFQLLTWWLRGRRVSDRRIPVAKLTKRVIEAAEPQKGLCHMGRRAARVWPARLRVG